MTLATETHDYVGPVVKDSNSDTALRLGRDGEGGEKRPLDPRGE